jgi:chemosensory pili system protein ChpA (sensor histidine kinase/response regulator)
MNEMAALGQDINGSVLIAELGNTLDTLSEMFWEESADGAFFPVNCSLLQRLGEQVGRIALAATEAQYLGLHDACLLFQERIGQLAARGGVINADERSLLEEWPTLVATYVQAPHDVGAIVGLVAHLQNPTWDSPISEDDAKALRCFLSPQPVVELAGGPADAVRGSDIEELLAACYRQDEAEEVATPSDVRTTEPLSDGTRATGTNSTDLKPASAIKPAIGDESPFKGEIIGPFPVTASEPLGDGAATLALTPSAQDKPEIADAIVLKSVEVQLTAEPELAMMADEPASEVLTPDLSVPPKKRFPEPPVEGPEAQVAAYEAIAAPDLVPPGQEPELLLEVLAPDIVALDETDAPIEPSSESADFSWTGALPGSTLIHSRDPDVEPTLSKPVAESESGESNQVPVLPAAYQELLELLSAEIIGIQASLATSLVSLPLEADAEALREVIETHTGQVERLGEAVQSVGFQGLARVCGLLQENLQMFAQGTRPLALEQRDLLQEWPSHVLSYLQAPFDRAGGEALVQYLQHPHWPNPISLKDCAALLEALAAPSIELAEEQAESRQQRAQPEDVSLALPEDVNPELLDSLLQELPSQTSELTGAIQRLVEGSGELPDIDVAKRIAHTLKGAANTVGVRGIASLTHHLEDILLALSKHQALPTRALGDSLLSAADCLETMSEALLGMNEPPPDAQDVLQEILDWANVINREGLPQGEARPTAPVPAPTPQAEETAELPPTAPTYGAVTPTLRVPAALIDELLRLLGETMILNGQLQDRLQRTLRQTRGVHEQYLGFQRLASELEQLVDIRGIGPSIRSQTHDGDFDPLEMEQYNELHTVSRRLAEAVIDARELNEDLMSNLTVLSGLLGNQGQLHRDVEETVIRTRMVPVQAVVPRLQRAVRQACRLTDKEADLRIRGTDTLIDSNVLNELVDPLMHILRNAVDHGIETPDARRTLGKDPKGRITLEFGREGNTILVRCSDDGAGVNYEAIQRAAEQHGLIGARQSLSREELIRLILRPGFSTRTEATQVSGRGIGMDVVHSRVMAMKGSLKLDSEPGRGMVIELRLPVTLMSTHGLLVRAGKELIAIADRGVERIFYTGDGELGMMATQPVYRFGEEIYEVTPIQSLLNLPPDRRKEEREPRAALLVQDEAGVRRIVTVQEVIDSRELVVKKMGRYLARIRGVMGATILGDGSVTVVLDLPEMLQVPVQMSARPEPEMGATAERSVQKLPSALVVDDSLSARRALTQFLQDAGFEVRAARDGLEAATLLQSMRPNILLVDLEMPRMNGLELATHVRSQPATRDLPIIMITSRSTEKHRSQAQAAGVNAYLIKPFSEVELLTRIEQLLTQLRGAA